MENAAPRLGTAPSAKAQQTGPEDSATTTAEYVGPHTRSVAIDKLFEERVRRTPDANAVICGERRLSYAQLNRAAKLTALQLIRAGVDIGEYVPIVMPRSIELIVSQLAVLKCGAAYVPIDPVTPAERLEFIVQDCAARRVLAREQDTPAASALKIHWIDVNHGFASDTSADLPARNLPPSSPAYVMFTSGSTGTPKGVIVPHRGISRLVINNGFAEIDESDRLAHCSNPSFDAATFEIWGALLNGAAVVVVPQCVLLDARSFARLLRDDAVTAMFLTTSLFNQYARSYPGIFSGLKHLLVGGEAADARCVDAVLKHSRPQNLLNAYGPTETTTFASTWRVDSVPDDAITLPIGEPIADTQIYVMDDDRQLVPDGTVGELYIGGAGVALGYLNRPELTAQAFVSDPFADTPDAVLYKTGDLGFRNADGQLELKGRKDFQVKIRGFRIELGEVEAALRGCVGIQQAAAVVREDRAGDKRLVAYVVPQISGVAPLSGPHETKQSIAQLKASLIRKLPDYMMPSSIVALDRLPLTSTGKLDRNALPSPRRRETDTEYIAPQTPEEQALCDVWQEIPGLDEIGIDDHFLELGGNSVLAMKIAAAIDGLFDTEIPVEATYRHPSIRSLAAFVRLHLSR